ncbi:2,3-dihydro-2,3-dihydroxybenzoate dehydrogenase [Dyella sp. M7H15-1]|uniref:2,3-dihydro-2,3-dihydroxybenzoate dehydrogenase n=1 Tax=Dyella sp. M7H15-1 TaxID=2501295 RepID=UPI0010051513|nr:2,3-dihydro-2,3-dihydroxybenzoate dehydrogenase [Dyella sp. M7H15-1]QAU23011.1 2,3-dihydro-2,3-dihydroxybenzoate dehydrogenase [Dyella sp. M7H15-1]
MVIPATSRFSSKTIVVTGAAQGIGAAVVRMLVAEGAFVHALDVNQEPLQQLCAAMNEHTECCEAIPIDISRREAVETAVAQIERRRPIDGLVNGAGVLIPAPFEAITPEAWSGMFDVNVHGTFFMSHSVARRMIERRKGAIVTIASNAATTPRMNLAAYCASKAAAAMLTKCMGLELGRHGIRCNVVSPGSTNTAMLTAMAGEGAERDRMLIDGDQHAYRLGIPLRKIAEPEDIARAVIFLLSDEANHITLHDLVVDGGATL